MCSACGLVLQIEVVVSVLRLVAVKRLLDNVSIGSGGGGVARDATAEDSGDCGTGGS